MTCSDCSARRGVIPVIVAEEWTRCAPLGDALKDGGLPVAEVTFRTAAAAEALRLLARDGDLLVGAGTVVRPEQVDLAHAAGARFVVTPGFSARVVERCRELGLPVIPGVATATEVIARARSRHRALKFFPAEASGGVAMVTRAAGPVPRGSLHPDRRRRAPTNAAEYLACRRSSPSAAAGWSRPRCSRQGLRERRALAAEAVAIAAQARP